MTALLKTIGWGLFCACSWTWCIGMFLPIVMVDRWGWAGFAAFAVPNVVGCAAFGYVLRDRQRAARLVDEHRSAMRWFSVVTLAYHVFFIGFIAWVLSPFEYWDGVRIAIVAPVALLAISALLARLPAGAWLPFALLVYLFSLGAFASIGSGSIEELPLARGEMTAVDRGLVWIVPALMFGFLLCPYLDMTFHRALQSSPSRHAFGVFGATFSVMIVFTLTYADALRDAFAWIVLAHITSQSIFTMAAHQRELLATKPSLEGPLRGLGRTAARAAAALAPLLAMPLAFAGLFHEHPFDASIDMYLRFLVFYGLIFPGYVLLFVGPQPVLARRRVHMVVFAGLMVAAAPLYELAFIRDLALLAVVPPVAIVLWVVICARTAAAT